ncbi:MAG: class I SAM-dependent methyltransferase [Candidatus Zixiibacteriota bacterium]|jgi:SAM-dependent methyltransferase
MMANNNESDDVRSYFEGKGVTFDTLYGGRRNAVMRWLDRNFRSDIAERFRITFDAFGDLAGKSVLDVGCGSGPYIVEALERGARRVVGVDVSDNMLELARGRAVEMGASERVELVRADFATWPPPERYDVTIVMGVLDYVEDAEAFMARVAAATSFRAAVSFPSLSWWRSPIRKVRYWWKRCPLYLYGHRRVEELAGGCGARSFDVIKIPGAGMDYVVVLYFD